MGRRESSRWRGTGFALAACAALALGLACSPKRYAVDKLADTLSATGDAYRTEEDPDLVRDAAPFGLKTMESVLEKTPRHRGLLTALTAQFTQYAFAYVQQPADEAEETDFAAAKAGHERARRLYLRAKRYGLRGLEVTHPGFGAALAADPAAATAACTRDDVALLYWAAAAWGSAVSLSKDRPETVAELPQVEALAARALALDETFDHGALHSFFAAFEAARPGAPPGWQGHAREHFDRAVALSGGLLSGPYVTMAEGWAVAVQDRGAFRELLAKALAVDVDAHPENRLANLVMQRRARWLLGREEALFFE